MTNPKQTKNGKLDHDYSLQLNRWFLKPIGAWPYIIASSVSWKIFLFLQIIICSIIMAINTVPCLLHLLFETQGIQSRLSIVGPLLHRLMGVMNYWTLISRRDDIRNCIRHMETDWRYMEKIEDRQVMLHYAKFGRFIAGICGLIMQGGTLLFSVAKSMKTTTLIIGNETFLMHPPTCPPYSKIIDARFSPVNEITIVMQLVSTFIVSSSTVGACSLAAVFAMHACGQLNLLYARLDDLVKNREKKYVAERKLAEIVRHHLRVLSFISRLESIMHKVSLVELAGCTISMCLAGYYIIMDWSTGFNKAKVISYFIVYLSMAFNIFIFCYIGEILTEQCKRVGEIIYMTDWYKLHHKTALNLVLIIARSSNVIKITAGKLFHLSIGTFGDVIKTSTVYLNLLRTVTI